jgi:GNAT superfamily N-acetyltransferase
LYKENRYSVPDLYEDMLDTFSEKNPAMDFCEAAYFLAYKEEKVVGRVAAIINKKANKTWNLKNVRFGWIDFVDDEEVSEALLKAVEEWGRERGMDTIQGPLGFTDMDAEGMLIEGFEELSTMATIYNFPYYQRHIERLGFEKDADWIEMKMTVPKEVGLPDRLKRVAEIVMKKYDLRIKKYTSSKKIAKEYGQEIFALINEAFKPLFGYSELSQKQIDHYVKMYLPVLDLKLVSLITEANGRLVAVGISMPSMSEALQKAKGKLFPFGWFHLLKALKAKQMESFSFLLIAVRPDYQNMGINALFLQDQIPIINQYGISILETTNILETNTKNIANFTQFDHKIHKRHRAYIKPL